MIWVATFSNLDMPHFSVSIAFTPLQNYFVGQQLQYKISQLHPGMKYTAQVRCVTDRGGRSVWSPERYIHFHSGESVS